MADYYVREEDGTSRYILEDSSGDYLLETSAATISPSFIASATVVNAPTLNSLGFVAPFIASVAAVFAPTVTGSSVPAPFIASVSAVYAPNFASSGDNVTFSTPGTFTWVCPSGITTVDVLCYGGGGGGGAASVVEGGGGGGGAFAERVAVPVTPGTSYTVVVGTPGAGQSFSAGPVTSGTSSTFTGDSGVQVIALGGTGGNAATAGAGGLASGSTGDTGLKHDGGSGGAGGGLSGATGGGGASGNAVAAGASGTSGAGGGAPGIGANGGGSGGDGNAGGHAGNTPGGGGSGGPATNGAGLGGGNGTVIISTGIVRATFIASVTVVYAPAFVTPGTPSLSTNAVFAAPAFGWPYFAGGQGAQIPIRTAPFIPSNTHVYTPRIQIAFAGAAVSQVALEVAGNSSTDADARVSQVTLEIVVPWYDGLHVWEKTGQTGG